MLSKQTVPYVGVALSLADRGTPSSAWGTFFLLEVQSYV